MFVIKLLEAMYFYVLLKSLCRMYECCYLPFELYTFPLLPFFLSLRSQFAACSVWTLCSSLISMECLKVGFAFPTVVTENHPLVWCAAVKSIFRIFVMMDVARSSESSLHLHAMPWQWCRNYVSAGSQKEWLWCLLGIALKLGWSRQRNTDVRND